MKKWAKTNKQAGFTIVELLIVIVVIGILAAITIVAFNGIQTRARDSERKSELRSVEKSLELYYADNGSYPDTVGIGAPSGCISMQHWNCWGAGTSTGRLVAEKYMSAAPQDPSIKDSGACTFPNTYQSRMYGYFVNATRQGYRLVTYMEGLSTSDPNYFDGSSNIGCANFANYVINKNF